MRGVTLSEGRVLVRDDLPEPEAPGGESLVAVRVAGICATDLALRNGYMGFAGTPGHEFVGVALSGPFAGRRVVGEINAGCGRCEACRCGLGRHCPGRTVLGILGRPGAFAERLSLPTGNLRAVPDSLSDDAAVFVEPLAAAFEMTEQVRFERGARALVAGDGRLGLLCAWVLHLHGLEVTVAGHHPGRGRLLPGGVPLRGDLLEEDVVWHAVPPAAERFDVGVEATGNPAVLSRLIPRVRPRGTLVVKTTSERSLSLDTAPIVVNELRLVGSRCGPFEPAIEALAEGRVPVTRWIEGRHPLGDAAGAFDRAARRGTLKILLDVANGE